MDSSRASSSIQLVQLPPADVHLQDASKQQIQPRPLPVAAEEPFSPPIEEQLAPRPDLGPAPESSAKAWLAVAGAFCYLFPTYGFMQSIGTIQAYLALHQLSEYTTTQIGWMTGLYTSLALLLGIQFGPLFDAYGPCLLGPIGCAIYFPMFFVLAECTKYWHFMLTVAIWGGFGAGIISTVGVAVIGKWFVKRRGLAMGVALCGSSTGGIVIPLLLRSLLPTLGWAWTIRILAFINTAVIIVGSVCLQQPLPRQIPAASEQRQRKRIALNFMALTSKTFTVITIGIFALEFAIFGVFGLLPTYAIAANFPASTGYALTALANGTSTIGRLLPGLAGDYFGHFNVLVCMILCTAAFIGAILVPFGSTSIKALYVFSALWGFGSGSFISLTPVCMGKTCETEDYGRYYGTMYFFVSFSLLLTVPLGGQMLSTFGTRALASLYVGIVLAAGVCFLIARQLLHGTRRFDLKAKI